MVAPPQGVGLVWPPSGSSLLGGLGLWHPIPQKEQSWKVTPGAAYQGAEARWGHTVAEPCSSHKFANSLSPRPLLFLVPLQDPVGETSHTTGPGVSGIRPEPAEGEGTHAEGTLWVELRRWGGEERGLAAPPKVRKAISLTLFKNLVKPFLKRIYLNSFDGCVSLNGTPSVDMVALQPWDLVRFCCSGWRLLETKLQ